MSYFTNKIDNTVVEFLRGGGVGLLPTDTIYGLSGLALHEKAVEKVHKLKGRDSNKPLVVLISDTRQLKDLGLSIDHADLIKKYWPGPLSVEFDATNSHKWLNRGGNFFAVRMPDREDLKELIQEVGPIVSSSANLQGHAPAKSVDEAQKYFGNKLDFYVDTGKIDGEPSTLIKIEGSKIKILRQGALKIGV